MKFTSDWSVSIKAVSNKQKYICSVFQFVAVSFVVLLYYIIRKNTINNNIYNSKHIY